MASTVVDLHNQSRRCVIDARSAASRGQNAVKATQVQNSGSEAAAVDAAKADRDWLSPVEVGRHDRQNSFLVAKRLGGSLCGRMVGTGKTIQLLCPSPGPVSTSLSYRAARGLRSRNSAYQFSTTWMVRSASFTMSTTRNFCPSRETSY